ncbi:MAG: glycosyltransferase [Pseudomonadota bacterium]
MIIALAVYGSLGDVQPFVALAEALLARGHEVRLAGPPEYHDLIRARGVDFFPLGANLREFMAGIPDVTKLSAVIRTAFFLHREFEVQLSRLEPVVKGADLALGASLCLGLRTAALLYDVPYRFIVFCPQMLPSAQHPNFLVRNHDRPTWFNRLSWSAVRGVDLFGVRRAVNRRHRRLGLPVVGDFWSHFLGEEVIVASDPEVAPVPPDAAEKYLQTGYWHLPDSGDLSPEIRAFLDAGDPPVYAGFGSMTSGNADQVTQILTRATRAVGRRLIVSRGWAKLGGNRPDPDILVIGPTPHARLFPRLAAVIHHGGAGTTHTAARAGVPQVIIPHILDQFYWGSRVHRRGLGPRPIWRARLDLGLLAAALGRAVADKDIRRNAAEAAERMTRRNALDEAVRYIEALA